MRATGASTTSRCLSGTPRQELPVHPAQSWNRPERQQIAPKDRSVRVASQYQRLWSSNDKAATMTTGPIMMTIVSDMRLPLAE